MVGACCSGCCQAQRGLPVGFLLLRDLVLFTVRVLIFALSPFFIDLYVLGADALINYGSFMQTKLLCVLIHI